MSLHNYSIIYEDDLLILINKPQGIPTAPGKRRSLCDLVFEDRPMLKTVQGYDKNEGGLLNRLDNETGGMVLFAKNDKGFKYYSDLMNEQKIEKQYIAIVSGLINNKSGEINVPIAHHNKIKKRMIIVTQEAKYRSEPQEAVTKWKLLKKFENTSLVELSIRKGVRHQIRVHMAHLGHPIVGDKLYNKENKEKYDNHLLFANGVIFKDIKGINRKIYVDVPFYNNFYK